MTNLTRWSPRTELDAVTRDPFFRRIFDVFDGMERGEREWLPALDVVETEKEIEVRLEIPGIDPKDVEVNLQSDVLTIRGERKFERDEKQENRYHLREQAYGTFQRAVRLPCHVNPDKVEAGARNGVMTITLPKADEHVGRRITVSGS
jgi:HSP20 family protein